MLFNARSHYYSIKNIYFILHLIYFLLPSSHNAVCYTQWEKSESNYNKVDFLLFYLSIN